MTVEDFTLIVYAVATWLVAFMAGRATKDARPDRTSGFLALVFATTAAAVLGCYMVWAYDILHRSAYMVLNLAVGLVTLSGWSLVWYGLRPQRIWVRSSMLGTLALLGLGVAATTLFDRRIVWPPFAYFSACLLVAAGAALVSRLRRRGYLPARDREFLGWVVLLAIGLLGVVETIAMVPLVFGVGVLGRPPLLQVFLADLVVLALLASRREPPVSGAPEAPGTIPWHLFNPPLSPREADLVPGLRRRLSNKELAAELGISESTVKKHLVSLFRKLGVETRQQLFERLDTEAVRPVPKQSETGP